MIDSGIWSRHFWLSNSGDSRHLYYTRHQLFRLCAIWAISRKRKKHQLMNWIFSFQNNFIDGKKNSVIRYGGAWNDRQLCSIFAKCTGGRAISTRRRYLEKTESQKRLELQIRNRAVQVPRLHQCLRSNREKLFHFSKFFDFSSFHHQWWKKAHFLAVLSLPVSCLSVMLSAKTEMFRNVHHWISYDQKFQNCSRLIQLWISLEMQKSLNQRWKWLNIYESSTREIIQMLGISLN